jgi:CheY-like chemotaxis protein
MTSADPSMEASQPEASASGPAATILVVDDEHPLREMMAQALEDVGYLVLQGFHGRHALEIIARHRPDLLISDIMMPLMGGR